MPSILCLFVPLLGAAFIHGPVLRLDLLKALKKPVDLGLTFRGKRVFGENKTWRGLLVMSSGVIATTLLLWWLTPYSTWIPAEVRHAGPLSLALPLAAGLTLGELPNSFVKRQLDVEPGKQKRAPIGLLISLYDQIDIVPAIWVFLMPVYLIKPAQILEVALFVLVVHMLINVLGVAVGARKNLL